MTLHLQVKQDDEPVFEYGPNNMVLITQDEQLMREVRDWLQQASTYIDSLEFANSDDTNATE